MMGKIDLVASAFVRALLRVDGGVERVQAYTRAACSPRYKCIYCLLYKFVLNCAHPYRRWKLREH